MKAFCTLFSILIASSFFAQSLEGSWQLTHENGEMLTKNEVIAIYQDGYFAVGAKEAATNTFLYAYGGDYNFKGRSYSETQDFNTRSPQRIGKTMDFKVTLKDDQLELSSGGHTQTWQRRSLKTDALTGNWVITGRERDGKINTMTPGDRRTIKILSGGRFQWVAFNSATKEFSGTGGGTYSANNGTYTEYITFFSRDDSRVGASLQFQYEVKEGQWHHKGNSSKGDPLYEIWSPYEVAYKK
ncbi:hypothetical protein [uncultured Planktosalinus sp.]|uniref:hypothetical protein n=1 Tax=uncultured Planktosalinus sp. TaxID=1810935 RepID=UPI0030D80C30